MLSIGNDVNLFIKKNIIKTISYEFIIKNGVFPTFKMHFFFTQKNQHNLLIYNDFTLTNLNLHF